MQFFRHLLVGNLLRLGHCFPDGQFRNHTGRSNGCTATKGLELDVRDHVSFHLDPQLHDIPATSISYFTNAVSICNFSYIAWIGEVIHHFI